jgi:MerR family transcriptional regulator/heat shock protein HspR
MPDRDATGLRIADVARQTGIPVTTLRFYERELPGLFRIRKTRGGHRRYSPQDVARFAAVRRLTEVEGLKLAEVRRVMTSRGSQEALREEVDLLLDVHEAETRLLDDLTRRLEGLEKRFAALEVSRPRKRGWLGRKG